MLKATVSCSTTVESERGTRNCEKGEMEETMSCQSFLQEQHVKSLQGHSCVNWQHVPTHGEFIGGGPGCCWGHSSFSEPLDVESI